MGEWERGAQSAYIGREDLSDILPLGGIRVGIIEGGWCWHGREIAVSAQDRRAWTFGVVGTKVGVGHSGHDCDVRGVDGWLGGRTLVREGVVGEAKG